MYIEGRENLGIKPRSFANPCLRFARKRAPSVRPIEPPALEHYYTILKMTIHSFAY